MMEEESVSFVYVVCVTVVLFLRVSTNYLYRNVMPFPFSSEVMALFQQYKDHLHTCSDMTTLGTP